jgi:hypothetical protein
VGYLERKLKALSNNNHFGCAVVLSASTLLDLVTAAVTIGATIRTCEKIY